MAACEAAAFFLLAFFMVRLDGPPSCELPDEHTTCLLQPSELDPELPQERPPQLLTSTVPPSGLPRRWSRDPQVLTHLPLAAVQQPD